MSEPTVESLTALAPVGSRWIHNYDPDKRELVCEGLAEWRDPLDWSPGVRIVPVVWIGNGTVREEDLQHYTRIDGRGR